MPAILPRAALLSFFVVTAAAPGQAPTLPASAAVDEAIQVGVELLLELQENYAADPRMRRMADEQLPAWQKEETERLAALRAQDDAASEWPYEGVYRTRGVVPAGYRVGATAIVCTALVEAPDYARDEARRAAVARATAFILDQLQHNEDLQPGPKSGYDVRGWGHTYALDFFLLALRRPVLAEPQQEVVRARIPWLIQAIATNEIRSGGGWNYGGGGSSPFMTGSTLLALLRAREQGFEVDPRMLERGLDALATSRFESGSYSYSGVARGRGNRAAMPGACARASIAELCLHLGGRSDARKLRLAVDGFFEHWGELLARKSKQGTHEGDYGIAPYYFFFGHTYVGLAIEYLPEADRAALRAQLRELLWRTREADGGWNDRVFPRSKAYGTAMAMLALLAPTIDRIEPVAVKLESAGGDVIR